VPVEFLNIRVAVRAPVTGSEVVLQGRRGSGTAGALKGMRSVYFHDGGGFVSTAVYDRHRLGVGDELAGPAVVEEEGSTLVVGPGWSARVVPTGNIIVSVAPHPALSPEGRGKTDPLAPGGGEGRVRGSEP
jgi:N-methylhydantoinase A